MLLNTKREMGSKILALSFLCAVLFASLFVLLSDGKYRSDDVDDSWSLSFAYNYVHRGIQHDLMTGFVRNQAGVQYFGKTYAFLLAKTLDRLGWNKMNGHLLSLACLAAGMLLWWSLLKHLGFSRELAMAFAVAAPLFEPFFSAAVSSRSEPFVFMLATLSAWLFWKDRYFLSALALGLALETHPAGVIGLGYILAVVGSDPGVRSRLFRRSAWNFAWIGAGVVMGSAYFAWLHWDTLGKLPTFLKANNLDPENSAGFFLFEYYFKTKYYRHLPELVIFLTAIFVYVREKVYRSNSFALWLLAFVLLFSLAVRHPNYHYTLYCYPAFLLITFQVLETRGRLWLALAGSLLLVFQYAAIWKINRHFDFSRQTAEIRGTVPRDTLPVLGSMNDWYAFYDRDFYYNGYAIDKTKLELGSFYLIEDENYRTYMGPIKKWIAENFRSEWVRELSVNGRDFRIYLKVPVSRNNPVKPTRRKLEAGAGNVEPGA